MQQESLTWGSLSTLFQIQNNVSDVAAFDKDAKSAKATQMFCVALVLVG
jgi:hypothetical protein